MTKFSLFPVIITLLAALAPQVLHGETSAENIYFIKRDGVSYLNYNTTRSSHPTYNLFLNKNETQNDFLYINPDDTVFDSESDPERNILRFPGGTFSTLREGSFKAKVTIDENGVHTFKNWDPKRDTKRADGHFGEWNTPDTFKLFVYAWVFPDNFEIVEYSSNRPDEGRFTLRDNTLAWYGKNVNDIVFTFRYQNRSSQTMAKIKETLKQEGVTPENAPDLAMTNGEEGVSISLANGSLFEGDGVQLSEAGRQLLDRLSTSLLKNNGHKIIVEGHTDNFPIPAPLKSRYANHWELSAARSLAVLAFLQQAGLPGERLESRSYGSNRPLASNETPEGRAKNGRIVIQVCEQD